MAITKPQRRRTVFELFHVYNIHRSAGGSFGDESLVQEYVSSLFRFVGLPVADTGNNMAAVGLLDGDVLSTTDTAERTRTVRRDLERMETRFDEVVRELNPRSVARLVDNYYQLVDRLVRFRQEHCQINDVLVRFVQK